jgi:hypothetical protein
MRVSTAPRPLPWPALFWWGALATNGIVFWMTVVPYLRTVGSDAHAGHAAGLLVHVLAGILLLPTGAAALYFGWTGRWRRFHRPLAHTYLASGTVCALSALSCRTSRGACTSRPRR